METNQNSKPVKVAKGEYIYRGVRMMSHNKNSKVNAEWCVRTEKFGKRFEWETHNYTVAAKPFIGATMQEAMNTIDEMLATGDWNIYAPSGLMMHINLVGNEWNK